MNIRTLFTAGALVSTGVLLSRVLGLLREMLLASRFGVGPEADMAVSLLLIPDFITGALAGTAVAATFVPLFTAQGRENAQILFWQALAVSLGVFSALALLAGFNAGGVVNLMGRDAGLPGAVPAFLLALATVPLTAATAIVIAWLQYQGRFAMPAFANAIFNGVVVLMLWLMPVGLGMLALSIFLGVLVRLLANACSVYRSGGRFISFFWRPWRINRPIVKNYLTTVATDICNILPQYAPYYLVAITGSGLAVFNYAFRLSVMPAMIGYNVVQMIFLPWFSRLMRDSGEAGKVREYSITLQCAWGLCLAVCLTFSMASRDAAQLCFGYGKMDPADIDHIGQLFALGVWSMAPILLTGIWQQLLYAHGQPRMPFIASVLQTIVIIPLCWMGRSLFGLEGIMAAYAVLQVISVALLSYDGYKQGVIATWYPSRAYGFMVLAALAAWLPLAWLYQNVTASAWLKIALAVPIGMVVLAAAVAVCEPVRRWARLKIKERMHNA